jgi:hypothetical protein
VSERTPRTTTGIQQQKSVRIIKVSLFPSEDCEVLDERTLLADFCTLMKIDMYATKMKTKAAPLNTLNTAIEYSHPAGRSADSCRGKQTVERP